MNVLNRQGSLYPHNMCMGVHLQGLLRCSCSAFCLLLTKLRTKLSRCLVLFVSVRFPAKSHVMHHRKERTPHPGREEMREEGDREEGGRRERGWKG